MANYALGQFFMIKYYSYDIFDTCLIRTCGRSNVVFDVLAKEILGDDADFNLLADFAYERKEGEKRARQKLCNRECEEVSFNQIYQECDFSPYTNIPNSVIKEKELNLEKKILRPVKSIKDDVLAHRKCGAQIIFISDMYLGSNVLKELLSEFGFYDEKDKLFVSCEAKVTKNTGNLYRYVAKEMNIVNFKEWQHIGDNFQTDVVVPQKIGIRAKFITQDYTYYERNLACLDFSCQNFEALKIASISRSILCEYGMTPRNAFAADFIAPMYVPFVEHVLAKAIEKGIKKLFFLARDGFILYKIAQILGTNYPSISLRYLHVSRDSLYLPGLPENYSVESVNFFFRNIGEFRVEDILHRLHMSDYDCSKIPLSGKSGKDILKILFDDENFRLKFEEKRLQQKKLCYSYLEQEGLTEAKSAIVDLTGTRRCHSAINRIIGREHEVFGFYFLVHISRDVGTNYYSMNYEERMNDNLINCNTSPQMLLENYFSITGQNRTCSYKQKDNLVVPEFEEDATSCAYRKEIYNINEKICLDFAKKYMIIANRKMSKNQSEFGIAAYSRFLFAPDLYYIKAFEGLRLSETKNISMAVLKKKAKFFEYEGSLWRVNKVYNSCVPQLMTFLFRIKMSINPEINGVKKVVPFFNLIIRIWEKITKNM